MNLAKRWILIFLVVLTQCQSIFSFNLLDREVSSSKILKTGALAIPAVMFLRVFYKNFTVDGKIKELKQTVNSFNNCKISPTDSPKDIYQKWSIKGWRLKPNGLNYKPEVIIPNANFIYLNEPLVVECLYNDLKLSIGKYEKNIYPVLNVEEFGFYELIPIDFTKEINKNSFKDERNGSNVIAVDQEVPTVKTLDSLNEVVLSEINKLTNTLQKLEKGSPLNKSLSELLVDACNSRRNLNYFKDIDNLIGQIKDSNYSKEYQNKMIGRLESFKKAEIADLSDLYLFNEDQLFNDNPEDRVESLQKIFSDLCKNDFLGLNCPEPTGLTGIIKRITPVKFIKDTVSICEENYPKFKTIMSKGKGYLTFEGKKAEELIEMYSIAYLQVAVNYAKLIKLSNLISLLIRSSGGTINRISPEQQLKNDKAKVVKKVSELIDMVTALKRNDEVTYVVLDKVQRNIEAFKLNFAVFELIKFYGSLEIRNLINNMLKKMSTDIKTLATYFGPNTPMMRNDDELEFESIFNNGLNHRVGNNRVNIYAEGKLNDAGLQTLRSFCTSWMVGLKEVEKLSKL